MIQDTILRNLANPEILKPHVKNRKDRQAVNICVVWGFFHSEIVDFHLGHLHIIQKARDFIDNQLNVTFIINDHIEQLLQDNQIELIYQKRVNQLKYFLQFAIKNDTQHLNDGFVHIGSERSTNLMNKIDDQFIKDKKELEIARQTLNDTFAPFRDLELEIRTLLEEGKEYDIEIEQKEKLKSSIKKRLNISEDDYVDLYKMLVGRNKFATKTEWASRFGALLASWKPNIDFIFVGSRHKYIWTYYKILYQLAENENFPKILLAKDFYDISGESPMDSNEPDGNIKVSDKRTTVLQKFEGMMPMHPDNCAFSNAVDYLIIPYYGNIKYGPKKYKKEYSSYKDLNSSDKIRSQKIKLVTDKLFGLLNINLDFFNAATKAEISGRNIEVSNYSILKAMSKLLGLEESIQEIESIELNEHPEEYINVYMNFIEHISSKYFSISRDNQITLIGSDFLNPLKSIRELVDKCKDMDLLLYLGEKNYRDHFLHQFNVASLGWLLINAQAPSGLSIKEEIIKIYKLDSLRDDFLDQELYMPLEQWLVGVIWWSCSLLHDHAYPISHTFNRLPRLDLISKQNKNIKMLSDFKDIYENAGDAVLSPELIRMIQTPLASGNDAQAEDRMKGLCKKYLSHILSLKDMKVVEEDYLWNHSTLGAINFLSRFDNIELGTFQVVIDIIAKSILLHEVHDLDIDFSKDPIPFLLVICDEIQEWGRRTILDKDYVSPLANITIGPIYETGTSFQSWILFNKLIIEFPYQNDLGNFLIENYKWSYDLFTKSKNLNFSRLIFPVDEKGPFPQSLQYVISIPSKIFKTEEDK